MSINYRKIFEQNFGPIPKEPNGRTYEIHHIDGNRHNNEPSNLRAVTIQEHYAIHHSQGDWAASLLIGAKMKLSPEILSDAARKSILKRIAEGNHPFTGPNWNNMLKAEGRHPLVGPKNNLKRIATGKHHFLDSKWQKDKTKIQLEKKTHNLLKKDDGSSITKNRVLSGKHNLLGGDVTKNQLANGTHPSQIKKTCPHCGKTVSSSPYTRFHGNNCKKGQQYA